jgi:hypothetical protein
LWCSCRAERRWRIGLCGRPPRDNARLVALYAILLTVVAGLVVPAGVLYVATRL